MAANRTQQSLPAWALPAVIVVGLILLVYFGWKGLTGTEDAGPPKEVHAGMYDIRQEAAKRRSRPPGTDASQNR